MKKTSKILLVALVLFLAVGCGCTDMKAREAVKKYLNNYKMLDSSVTDQIDDLVDSEDMSDDQRKIYKEILKKQFEDMKYEITDETYEGDEAQITAKITVYDYYKVQSEISKYLSENRDKFYDDGEYNESLYIDYKLDTMKKYDKTITYTVVFDVVKENNKWLVVTPSDEDIEKIHGIYDYSND